MLEPGFNRSGVRLETFRSRQSCRVGCNLAQGFTVQSDHGNDLLKIAHVDRTAEPRRAHRRGRYRGLPFAEYRENTGGRSGHLQQLPVAIALQGGASTYSWWLSRLSTLAVND